MTSRVRPALLIRLDGIGIVGVGYRTGMYRWNERGLIPTPDAWREAFIDLHGASRVTLEDAGPWAGRLEWQRSRSYGIALCGNVREEFVRERRHIRTDPRGAFELLVPTAGSAEVEQASAAGEIRPGTLALCDVDRPLTFTHGEKFQSVALIVPGEAISRRNPAAAGDSRVFDLASSPWDNRSIAQVAHASGFAGHASFATAYRREFGVTPRETRGDRRGES